MPMALAMPYADYVLPTGTKVSSGVKVCFCGLLHVSCTYMFAISLNHATCTCTSCITHSINVLIHRFKAGGGEGGGVAAKVPSYILLICCRCSYAATSYSAFTNIQHYNALVSGDH